MKTHILIAQPRRVAAVNTPRLRALAAWLLERAREWKADFTPAELSIALVDDAGIAPLNKQFMRHDGATDVISFRLEPPPGQTHAAGEIVINLQRAIQEAARRRGDANRELAWYLAHGIDHLAGAVDRTTAQRAAMHAREKRWLAAAAKAGLLDTLINPDTSPRRR